MPISSDRKQQKAREARLRACQDKPHLQAAIDAAEAREESKHKLARTLANLAGNGVLVPKPGVMKEGIQELREAGHAAVARLPIEMQQAVRHAGERQMRNRR